MLTTIKYLMFLTAFVTVFGLFMSLYSGADVGAIAIDQMQLPGGASGTLRITRNDNAPIYTRLGVGGVAVDAYAVHYDYQDDYEFDFHFIVYGDNGGGKEFVWPHYIPDVAFPYEAQQSTGWYRITIMWDRIQLIIVAWSSGQNMDFSINRPILTTDNAAVYAEARIETSTGANESLWDRIKSFFMDVGTAIVGVVGTIAGLAMGNAFLTMIGIASLGTFVATVAFGSSPTAFIGMIGKLLTFDFPGVPPEIRLMIAAPLVFMTAYVILIVVRSFIPTVGGGSMG